MAAIRTLCAALFGLFAAVGAPMAAADIAAFNAAVTRGDYPAAAAAAADAWPDLDKTREDLPLIAREFAFAAVVAKDFGAAKQYAEAAIAFGPDSDPLGVATVLAARASLAQSPSVDTRRQLFDSLTHRASHEGTDLISILAADVLLGHDVETGNWADAIQSAELGVTLTSRGGGRDFRIKQHEFALSQNISTFMDSRRSEVRKNVYPGIIDLFRAIAADMERMPSDEAAEPFLPIYWNVRAWESSIRASMGALRGEQRKAAEALNEELAPMRVTRLTQSPSSEECPSAPAFARKPVYPSSAFYKGMVGTIIIAVDVDAGGGVTKHKLLAAFPQRHFKEAVDKYVEGMRFKKGNGWDASKCSLVAQDRVVTFAFQF